MGATDTASDTAAAHADAQFRVREYVELADLHQDDWYLRMAVKVWTRHLVADAFDADRAWMRDLWARRGGEESAASDPNSPLSRRQMAARRDLDEWIGRLAEAGTEPAARSLADALQDAA